MKTLFFLLALCPAALAQQTVDNFIVKNNLTINSLSASRVLVSNGSKVITASATTATEVAALTGLNTATSLQAQLDTKATTASVAVSARLIEITAAEGYELTSCTVDSDGCITTGTVKWSDGSAGTFTRTAKDSTWLVVNAYTITHTSSGKTVTQSTVTRDSSTGAVTTKPALTVSP